MATILTARLKLLKRIPSSLGFDSMRNDERAMRIHKGRTPGSNVDFYRALCGFIVPTSGQYCSGDLGFVYRKPYGSPANITGTLAGDVARLASDDPDHHMDQTQWFLYHLEGLSQQDDGSYRAIVKPKRDDRGERIGRRPVPKSLDFARGPAAPARAIVGRLPTLPAIVICPVCGRSNNVEIPAVDVREVDAEMHRKAEASADWHATNRTWEQWRGRTRKRD